MSNLYQPPQESRLPAACHILKPFSFCRAGPLGFAWVTSTTARQRTFLLCDDDMLGLRTCCVRDAHDQPISSRWSSNRCVDYAVTSIPEPFHRVSYDSEAIVDHKAFCCTIDLPTQSVSAPLLKIVRHEDLSKPDVCTLE